MLTERITNILKRMSFKYFTVTDIDNTNKHMVTAEITNNITKQEYKVHFPFDMLQRWYDYNNLKYDLIKEYILANISEDYDSTKEQIYE
ncbi:hypothetical protein [Staphylococcus phage PT1-4]